MIRKIFGVVLVAAMLPLSLFSQESEIEELRAMVTSLKAQMEAYRGEVDVLKAQLETQSKLEAVRKNIHQQIAQPEAVAAVKPSVTSRYGIQFYGYFKADVFHNSATTAHQEIPFWSVSGVNDGGDLDFTARQTRLGMNFDAGDVRGGSLTGKLETDFFGNFPTYGNVSGNHAYTLRTRQVYMQWKNADWTLLAGKAFEGYILEIPETVNFGYYNFQGQLGHRRMQLRASRFLDIGENSKLELTMGLDEPVGAVHGGDLDGDGKDDGTEAEFPGISARTKFTTPGFGGRPIVLGLAGFYSKENVYERDYDGYAIIGSASIPLTDWLSWRGVVWQGENVDSAWGGIAQGINTSLNREIAAHGGWTQLKIKPTANWWMNLGYSVDDPEDNDLNLGQRSKNETLLVNTYYKVASPVTLALEYFRVDTSYKGSDQILENHHFMSSVIFSF
jgi:hypothetical protein